MKMSVICFTKKGYELMKEVIEKLKDNYFIEAFCKCKAVKEISEYGYEERHISLWSKEQFEKGNALLFIGSVGIAVRGIADSVKDKLSDSPVAVMDDNGRFVIPVLSGHAGGANEIALLIEKAMGAKAVITTSTDVNNTFSVDVFAVKNRMTIKNKEGIVSVSAKVLDNKEITIAYDSENPPDTESYEKFSRKHPGVVRLMKARETGGFADVFIGNTSEKNISASLYLEPKRYVLGIGCRRGKKEGDISTFVLKKLKEYGIDIKDVRCIASIDLKKDEEGIVAFAQRHRIPFVTFSAEKLNALEGDFNDSDFVKAQVGVGNVSERSALAPCEGSGRLVIKKQAENGITMAAAYGGWRFCFE